MRNPRKKKEYSTLMIVSKNNPSVKSFSVRTKHIERMKYYIISLGLILVSLVIAIVVLNHEYQKNESAKRDLERFKKEIAGPLATDTNIARIYIKKIDSKLIQIKEYLKKRGVKELSSNIGGHQNVKIKAIASYKYYNIYLASLLKDIKYLPLGYPHANHRCTKYGYRANPFSGRGSEFHSGVDIIGDTGDPVMSTANGTVIVSTWHYGYGKCVRIQHKHGYQTLYGHLSKINVKNGQKISANQIIGELGSTGRSTGPHLHYEVRYLDRPIDPSRFLSL